MDRVTSRIAYTLERYRNHVAWSAWYGSMAFSHVLECRTGWNPIDEDLSAKYASDAWHEAQAAKRVERELDEEIAQFLHAEYDKGLADGRMIRNVLGR